MSIESGTKLGPYEITGLIASGGMGEVYRARDTRLERDVAIKVLPQQLTSDAALRERLLREARAISSLTHPNICTLHDIGREGGTDYLVMEHLEGETLADRIGRGSLALSDVVRIGSQIADAVEAAHRRGIVHRDLKPGNVMLTKSGAKVLDFGLAVPIAESEATQVKSLTQTGHVVGTLQYMSPEQLRAEPLDARSDIYSLGAILYEMVSGKRAFNTARRELPPAIEPASLDALVRRCLAEDPDDRFQSARDIEFALQDVGRSRSSRTPLVAAIAALIVIVVALSAWLVIKRGSTPSNDHRPSTIAVLPFANLGVDRSHDYLRLAIPDEITTILTYNPELAVRPFSASRLFEPNIDPQLAAKKLNAAAIVSGHLLDASGQLSVTLEAIDVNADKLLWRDMFEVAASDPVTMRNELGARIERGLLPRLAGSSPASEPGVPKNRDAYVLFLRAAAMANEGAPNRDALNLLQEAVRLEPDYANAWSAIAARAYYDAAYGNGGAASRELSMQAATRALQLDPNLAEAATRKIVIQTEHGDTIAAYRDAKQLVEKRPRSADAHFNMSYVLRYGGALEESARECDQALQLDPGNRLFRSCAATFASLEDRTRAAEVEQLDANSGLVRRLERSQLLREHKIDDAIRLGDPRLPISQLLIRVRDGATDNVLEQATSDVLARAREVDDGESYYGLAGILAAVGRSEAALALLRDAVSRNFCTYPAIDRDSLYDSLRKMPAYAQFHAEAVQCHERFMAAIRQ